MILKISFLVSCLVALMASTVAEAGVKFSIVGAVDNGKLRGNTSSITYEPKSDYGGGALLELGAMSVGLEVGALYIRRKYDQSTTSNSGPTSTTVSEAVLQIPALLRWHLFPAFSIGAGGYYSKAQGSNPAFLKKTDYGALGSVQLDIPLGLVTGLIIDGRYGYGIANVSQNTGNNLKHTDIQGLIGLRFGMAK